MTDLPPQSPQALVRPADVSNSNGNLEDVALEPQKKAVSKWVLDKNENLIMVWNRERAKKLVGYLNAECGALLDESKGVYHLDRFPETATGGVPQNAGVPGMRDYWGISGAFVRLQYVLENGEVKAPLCVLVRGDPDKRECALDYLVDKAGGSLE